MNNLSIPLYMQGLNTNFCVPYALTGVAHYYGIDITKKQMIKLVNCTKSGTYHKDAAKGLLNIGLKYKKFKFNYINIRKSLKKGIPILVSYISAINESHVAIIVGARKNNRGLIYFTLNDTYYGQYEIPERILNYLMYKDSTYVHRGWSRQIVLNDR